jgi:hypothetical protein
MKRVLLVTAATVLLQVAPTLVDRADAQFGPDKSVKALDSSKCAFVVLPEDGQINITYRAKWADAVAVYRINDNLTVESVVVNTKEAGKAYPLKAGKYMVTAWSKKETTSDRPWRQIPYRIEGTRDGFNVGFNDGREPAYDDAVVQFAWEGARRASGVASGSQQQTKAEERSPQSGAGAGAPGGAPAPAASPGQGPLGLPLPGASPEKGAR